MDFARKILQNYGWKEGDGLGKSKNGIAKPIKATLKFDNAGFGADQAADDFNNHWWERVYNEAATNVNILQEGGQIKMNLKDEEDSVEISTKGYSMKRLKKLRNARGDDGVNKNSYENFLRAATLTNLGNEAENPNKIDTNFIEVPKVKVLTDKELFKACGGRTAHKGARHGLKLNGKLSRIAQQESELLAKMMLQQDKLNNVKQNSETKSSKNNPMQNEEQKKKNQTNILSNEECPQLSHVRNDNMKRNKSTHVRVASGEIDINRGIGNKAEVIDCTKKIKKDNSTELSVNNDGKSITTRKKRKKNSSK